ncbi:MAG: 2Fe-2S iron-sulfur cluster-binding protein [Bacteroidales bacterium]
MHRVTIDDITIDVEEGTTILNAARKIGGEIVPPAMCYYSKLKGSGGKCRTCLVKIVNISEIDPRPLPKLVPSCCTLVQNGMRVQNITSEEVQRERKAIVEFLLINHPLDCPVCDQAGECDLQNLSYQHGLEETRYEEDRREYTPADFGEKIKLNMNRCILCYRCVYAAEQITEERVHGVLYRGDVAEITTFVEKFVDNDFSGNIIDVCPVGALTDRSFRFKNRVWFTKAMDAHRDCEKCSSKAVLWMFGTEIYRVTGRKNQYGEVEEFICNDCRFEKKNLSDWVVEGPRKINRTSVIAQNHYEKQTKQSIIKPIEGKTEKQE